MSWASTILSTSKTHCSWLTLQPRWRKHNKRSDNCLLYNKKIALSKQVVAKITTHWLDPWFRRISRDRWEDHQGDQLSASTGPSFASGKSLSRRAEPRRRLSSPLTTASKTHSTAAKGQEEAGATRLGRRLFLSSSRVLSFSFAVPLWDKASHRSKKSWHPRKSLSLSTSCARIFFAERSNSSASLPYQWSACDSGVLLTYQPT